MSGNSVSGFNYRQAGGVTRKKIPDVRADSLAVTKKWTQPKKRFASGRKFTIAMENSSHAAKNFLSIPATKACNFGLMRINRQIVAEKLTAYLQGRVSQAELVDWAERALMDEEFEERDVELLSDIVGRLGLADVAEFGLRWEDCESFLRRLGYRARVEVTAG